MRHPREGENPSCYVGRGRSFLSAWSVSGRVGPGRPPRNSFAGLVRQNRCGRGARSGQHVWQRFCQRCLSQSDSRGNLPGPTRPATVLRYAIIVEELCDIYVAILYLDRPTSLCVIPAKAGIHPALRGDSAVFRLPGVCRGGLKGQWMPLKSRELGR